MRTEYIEMSDLTDSREMMEQKSPKSIRIFITIIVALLIISLIWTLVGKIDNHVKASGEIRPCVESNTITLLSGGKIKEKYFTDNSYVEKGDIIISLDSDYYLTQKAFIQEKINNNNADIENYKKLITSIKEEKNCFDEKIDPIFFCEYEKYASEIDNAVEQLISENTQVESSLSEIENTISENCSNLSITNEMIDEYKKMYAAVEKDQKYESNNETISQAIENYTLSLEKTKDIYNQYKSNYEYLKSQELTAEFQLEQAFYTMTAAEKDVELVKNNMLVSINDTIAKLEQEAKNYQANIKSYELKKSVLSFDVSENAQKSAIKNSYFISINNSIESIKSENQNLESQLAEINLSITQTNIIAEQSGILLYNGSYNIGDVINSGAVIASIVPDFEELTVVLYIPEYNITDVKQGQQVEYIFDSISSTDFGKAYGEIVEISADSFLDETSGQKYYKAKSSINRTFLENKKNELKNLKIGMLLEAHAITGTQTIFSWLMDYLNFT